MPPTTTTDEDFEKTLAVASEQIKNNKIQVRFAPSGKPRFTIDEAGLKESLVKSGITEDVFRRIFHQEIGLLMGAVLQDRVQEYLDSPFSGMANLDATQQDARRTLLRERAKAIERELLNPEIRARYLIKASSKHPRLRGLRWEIAKKLSESSSGGAIPVQPYATLEFEAVWPEKELGMFSWLALLFPAESAGRREALAFDCDNDDVDDLIKALQDAKAALEAAKGN